MFARIDASLAFFFALFLAPGAFAQSTQLKMDFTGTDFYDIPFPNDNLLIGDPPNVSVDLRRYDTTEGSLGVVHDAMLQIMGSSDTLPTDGTAVPSGGLMFPGMNQFELGFSTSSAVTFQATSPIDPTTLPGRGSMNHVRYDTGVPIPQPWLPPQDVTTNGTTNVGTGVAAGTAPPDLAHTPSVFLLGVQTGSPDFMRPYPVMVGFEPSPPGGGPSQNQLSLVPLPGTPLLPNTLYAAVVLSGMGPQGTLAGVGDAAGFPLVPSPTLQSWIASFATTAIGDCSTGGATPLAASHYCAALAALHGKLPPDVFGGIVGLAVFTTGNPTAGFSRTVTDAVNGGHAMLNGPIHLDNIFSEAVFDFSAVPEAQTATGIYADFCVYRSTVTMPVYQEHGSGTHGGYGVDHITGGGRGHGAWHFNSSGNPLRQWDDPAGRIVITVPRLPMPPGGFPVVVFERAGGGGETPLVSRAPTSDSPFYNTPIPGGGPAQALAKVGFVGVEIDDPLGGLRRQGYLLTDEDNYIFNEWNLAATRDNVRQAALELVVVAHLLSTINGSFDISQCPAMPGQYTPTGIAGSGCTTGSCTEVQGTMPVSTECPPETANTPCTALTDVFTENCVGYTCVCTTTSDSCGNVLGTSCIDGSGQVCDPCNPGSPTPPVGTICTDSNGGLCAACTDSNAAPRSSTPVMATFNLANLTLMGHSVGSTVSPLALSYLEPATGKSLFRQAIMSGAGGSYLDNLLYKEQPRLSIPFGDSDADLRHALEAGAALRQDIFNETNPDLNVGQWVLEPADPPPYNRGTASQLAGANPSQTILMFQGIVDHYIEPTMANAASLSLGLNDAIVSSALPTPFNDEFPGGIDLAGNPVGTSTSIYDDVNGDHSPNGCICGSDPVTNVTCGPIRAGSDFRAWSPLRPLIEFSGWSTYSASGATSSVVPLPVQGTSVVRQEVPSFTDPQDGHEIMFQHAAPKYQYRCFLQTSLLGPPVVVDPSVTDAFPSNFACCEHTPLVAGSALLSSCDCCVNTVCTEHPNCCDPTAAWDSSCVSAYQQDAVVNGLCNANQCSTANYCNGGPCSYSPVPP
jgi:hypothetical protein